MEYGHNKPPNGEPSNTGDGTQPAMTELPRALIADDYASARLVLSGLMESLGYDVTAVNDGRQLLEASRSKTAEFAMMIIDVDMPVMSGPEALNAIREGGDQTPAILISGAASEGLSIGLDEHTTFLRKPFSRSDLADAMNLVTGSV